VVDYRHVQRVMLEWIEENNWNVQEICYDEWSAGLISQELAEKEFTMVEIPQRLNHLSEPTKNFREMAYQKELIHNNNPVLNFAIGNAIEKEDHNGNIMLDKSKSKFRIDPAAAAINAHSRAMLRPKPKKSVYEERGMRRL